MSTLLTILFFVSIALSGAVLGWALCSAAKDDGYQDELPQYNSDKDDQFSRH